MLGPRFIPESVFYTQSVMPGAIIGDGDRKSWDARGPMI